MIDVAATKKIVTVSESSDSKKRARSPPPVSSDESKKKVLRKLSDVEQTSLEKEKVASDYPNVPATAAPKKLKEINSGVPPGKIIPPKMVKLIYGS
jgi:hypothetical protein